jgi:DNA polymerase III delta prime subunit
MLEVQDVLKSNYMLLLKWGFYFEDRSDKVKYSLSNLKKNARIMRKKIEEINSALDKFNQVLKKEENNLIHIQNIAK